MSLQPAKPSGLHLSQSLPEELQMFSCSYPNCDYKDKWELNVARHENCHIPLWKRDFPCQVCPQTFSALVSFLHHMSTHHGDKLFCPFCQCQVGHWTKLKPHILTHGFTLNSMTATRKSLWNGNALRCAICSINFICKESLSQHLKKCSRKLNPVRPPAKKLETAKSQESFEHSKRMEESRYRTEETSNSSSIMQARDWTEFKPNIPNCSSSVYVPQTRKSVESGTVPRCAICSITFTSEESLSQHLKTCCHKLKPLPSSSSKKVQADNLDKGQTFENLKQTDESSRNHDQTEDPGAWNQKAAVLTMKIETKDNLGSDTEYGNHNQVNGEVSSNVTFACMLCDFIADGELSAWKHSSEHMTVVVMLNRN